jgi:drug/metabolite transporter (DMT)-like permease
VTGAPADRAVRRDLLGTGLMVVASLSFGTVVAVGKVATDIGLSVYWVLAVRFAVATVLTAGILALLRQPLVPVPGERVGIVVLGAAGYAVEASFFFLALQHGNASTVTLLFFTYPAMVMLGSMALGRGAPGLLLGGALVCAIAGAALVVASSGGIAVDPLGVVFSLSAGAVFSVYLLGIDRVLRRTNALTASLWVSGSASIALAAFSLASGRAEVPVGLDQWGPVVWMGVATSIAFVAQLAGLRILGPVRTAIIGSTEPVAGAALSFVFLDEPITAMMVLGGALILTGAVAAALARRPEPGRAPGTEVALEPPAP